MNSTVFSGRPPCIKIRIIGDESWAKKIFDVLKRRMGASVSRNSFPPTKDYIEDLHVLILQTSSDPEFEFLLNLREKWDEKDIPVIVVGDSDESETKAMQAGASAFVDESVHGDGILLEKLVFGLALETEG